eukprot:GHVP01051400.1.p1 GENE.GHVP01051400.1~~GHVP01051400.1.p1  ORF type:complete len:228 (+),score=38.46 GHVP01051400.1:25-684(+)
MPPLSQDLQPFVEEKLRLLILMMDNLQGTSLLGEKGFQELFTSVFLRPIINKYMDHEAHNSMQDEPLKSLHTFSIAKLPEHFEADVIILSQKTEISSLTVIEFKQYDRDLLSAMLQAALYAVLYHTTIVDTGGKFYVSLVSVSLPDFCARIGSFWFTLSQDCSVLQESRLEIGQPFRWNTLENASLLVSHILSEPLESLHLSSDEIEKNYFENPENQHF